MEALNIAAKSKEGTVIIAGRAYAIRPLTLKRLGKYNAAAGVIAAESDIGVIVAGMKHIVRIALGWRAWWVLRRAPLSEWQRVFNKVNQAWGLEISKVKKTEEAGQ